ncbi:MAG: hypothetical protein COW42_12495 [Deltaproteobacteria bacterium CG17_big_fil_post_rev_8_21_14_2_50_63_7]|nr:MAG: hypothetical protein COW42_12495 [Deltaproteobacteria bacterium CG17_big_fil_post_rev_8_21_14_2_50_63_7]
MTTRHTVFLLVAITALFLVLPSASAGSPKLFLNGVDITGVTDQEFEGTKVRIDSTGNIYLEAPQYKVEVQDPNGNTAQAAAPGTLSGNYYVVGANAKPGSVQFDIVIYVNGTMFKTFKDNEGQIVADITDKLALGSNTVTLQAKKVISGGRASTSSSDVISVFIGKGNANGNQLTIDKQLATFKVDASQTADKTESFTFDAN